MPPSPSEYMSLGVLATGIEESSRASSLQQRNRRCGSRCDRTRFEAQCDVGSRAWCGVGLRGGVWCVAAWSSALWSDVAGVDSRQRGDDRGSTIAISARTRRIVGGNTAIGCPRRWTIVGLSGYHDASRGETRLGEDVMILGVRDDGRSETRTEVPARLVCVAERAGVKPAGGTWMCATEAVMHEQV